METCHVQVTVGLHGRVHAPLLTSCTASSLAVLIEEMRLYKQSYDISLSCPGTRWYWLEPPRYVVGIGHGVRKFSGWFNKQTCGKQDDIWYFKLFIMGVQLGTFLNMSMEVSRMHIWVPIFAVVQIHELEFFFLVKEMTWVHVLCLPTYGSTKNNADIKKMSLNVLNKYVRCLLTFHFF